MKKYLKHCEFTRKSANLTEEAHTGPLLFCPKPLLDLSATRLLLFDTTSAQSIKVSKDKIVKRFQRHSAYTRLATGVGVGTGAVYGLAEILPYADPVPAAITVVVASQVTLHQATKVSTIQILGALIGGALAVGVVTLFGANALVIGLLVTLAYIVARVVARFTHLASEEESPFVGMRLSVTIILLIGVGFDAGTAVDRLGGVLLGSIAALFVTILASPAKWTRTLKKSGETLAADTRELLGIIGEKLGSGGSWEVRNGWYEESIELRNRSLGLSAGVNEIRRNRRWTLLVSQAEVSELVAAAELNYLSTTRLLSLCADLRGGAGAIELPEEVRAPLALLMQETNANMGSDDPTGRIGVIRVREALSAAEETSQLALVGGIVSHLQRINVAHTAASKARSDDDESEEDGIVD